MKALVYHGPGKKSLDERPMPTLIASTDAIVRMTRTTICGTDLHILKGDVPSCEPGRVLGHEGVGAIEAVGVPATFELCEALVAPGGVIANVGVHGVKADLHLDKLWDRNISITTRLVDTVSTPMLLKTVCAGRIDPTRLITHRFQLEDMAGAYDTFSRAAQTHALKVIIEVS
ncbi:Alcohol dehydrogenase [Burkholderia sp. AD24]|nr:Alcohol dehydrogenase [Burkholderia sp. AD24]